MADSLEKETTKERQTPIAEAALAALKDVAAVDAEAKRVLGKATAGGAWTGELALRRGL